MRRRELLVGVGATVGGLTDWGYSRVDYRTGSSDDELASSDDVTETLEVGDPDAVVFPDAHPAHELEVHNGIDDRVTVSIAIESERDDDAVEDDDAADDTDGVEDDATENDDTGEDESTEEEDGEEENDDPTEDDAAAADEDLEREIELPDGGTLEVVFVEPRSYRVSITVTDPDGGEATVNERIDRSLFDCVRSETSVTITESGLETESSSTRGECPEPTVTDRSLERGEQDCAGGDDEDEATVAFIDEAVVVEGAVRTPTPCHELEIESAAYDADRGVLELGVAVGDGGEGVCVQCIGIVAYEARIDVDGRYPDHVEVVHDRDGETVAVESIAYEDADERDG